MDKKNLMPQAAQPVNRTTTGQLPAELAELSEEALQQHSDEAYSASVLASYAARAASGFWLKGRQGQQGQAWAPVTVRQGHNM